MQIMKMMNYLLDYCIKVWASNPIAIANRETQNLHNEILKCKTYYTQCKIFVMPMQKYEFVLDCMQYKASW